MPDGMPYADFLNAVIDDGLDEVRRTYLRPDQAAKRDGAIRGFEECRGLDADALLDLMDRARVETAAKRRAQAPDYWFWRMRESQVEWVLNVVNAANYEHGRPVNFPPTARGMSKAIDVLQGSPA
jgi:hypothetical protein